MYVRELIHIEASAFHRRECSGSTSQYSLSISLHTCHIYTCLARSYMQGWHKKILFNITLEILGQRSKLFHNILLLNFCVLEEKKDHLNYEIFFALSKIRDYQHI